MLLALTAPEPDGSDFQHLMARGEGASIQAASCSDPLDRTEIVGETIYCGTVTVPEDHDAPDNGQTIDLAFAILRADTTYPASDPLVYLHAGPGIGNLYGGLAFMAEVFAPFRATRDVVISDQRAAGISSGSVSCQQQLTDNITALLIDAVGPLEADDEDNPVVTRFLRDCLAEVEADGTDLSKYNTRQNALDVAMILKAMGYDEWNLYGIEAMTDAEIVAVYDDVFDSIRTDTLDFQQEAIDLMLYACQEDAPYNGIDGYRTTTADQPYDLASMLDGVALELYATSEE